jgi:ribosome maturation factor RimP
MAKERDVVERIRPFAAKAAAEHGAELWDVEVVTDGGRRILRVTLDRPEGSVDLATCEAVSRDLSTYLDVEDAVPFRYTLEVSSPGLTRPLKHPDDFRRSVGKLAVLVLSEPVGGEARWRGVIASYDPDGPSVVVRAGEQEAVIPLSQVRRAHLDIDF